jgi:hypothetical protein
MPMPMASSSASLGQLNRAWGGGGVVSSMMAGP